MSRDRLLIVVLVALLGVSLFFNFRLWQRVRAGGGAGDASDSAAEMTARKSAPRERGAAAHYEVVANPSLKGRLGRIVVTYAEGVDVGGFRTAFFQAGKADLLRASYGVIEAELMPGEYDLDLGGKRISGIPVESGKDTRLRAGVLRLHGDGGTRFTIFDPGAQDNFRSAYGNSVVGLPVGDYEVEVSGMRDKITIEAGKVTEF